MPARVRQVVRTSHHEVAESRFRGSIGWSDQPGIVHPIRNRRANVIAFAQWPKSFAHSLVEMFGRNPAPLRAWVRLGNMTAGTVRMDTFGCSVLGVVSNRRIYVRRVDTPIVPKGLAGSVGRLGGLTPS